jgi:integrase
MATIRVYDGKKGRRYSAQIRVGSHSESKTFSTKTAAKDWAKKREVELKERPHLAASEARKHTLGVAIDRYLANYLPHKSASMQRDQTAQLRWWKQHYGDLKLSLVQAPLLVEARDKLANTLKHRGKVGTLSPATVNRHLAAMSVVLGLAHKEWHWIQDNPMRAVSRLKEAKPRTRYLKDEGERPELVRLLSACRISESQYLYTAVLMAITTGARQMEILSLRWSDVDLVNATITIRDTKNGDTRVVALSPDVMVLLKERRGVSDALVFPSLSDPTRTVDLNSAWKTALRRAGIEDFRWHDLRHTAASYLAMEGATSAELAGVLGHRTLAMVKRYSHLSPDHVAKVSNRIAARINAKVKA